MADEAALEVAVKRDLIVLKNGQYVFRSVVEQWAVADDAADARSGHGSFCTPSYIEINRANCMVAVGRQTEAVALYEQGIPQIPTAYRRDRAVASCRLAAAYAATGEVEQAATTALATLPVARETGSLRAVHEVERVAVLLVQHKRLPVIAELLEAVGERGVSGHGK